MRWSPIKLLISLGLSLLSLSAIGITNQEKLAIYDHFAQEASQAFEAEYEGKIYQIQPFTSLVDLAGEGYQVIEELGKGVEGTVYLMQNQKTHRQYAVKMYGVEGYPWQPFLASQAIHDVEHNAVLAYPPQKGDWVLFHKLTGIAQSFINVPLMVNVTQGFSMFPLLVKTPGDKSMPLLPEVKKHYREANRFLRNFNIQCRDKANDNVMYDQDGGLRIVDLASCQEIQ